MDDARIAEIKARLEDIISTWPTPVVDAAMGDHYECPMCDCDGYVDGAQFEVDALPVYIQAYGIGEEVQRHNEFIRHAPADIRALLDRVEELEALARRQHGMLADILATSMADASAQADLLMDGRKLLGVE